MIKVGSSTLVSEAQRQNDQNEILAAADPEDSKHLLVCTMIWSNEQNRLSSAVYASLDGGHTWQMTQHDEGPGIVFDPACGYGVGGTAYFGAIDLSKSKSVLNVHRSVDAAQTWAASPISLIADRDFLTADTSSSTFRGRLYLYGLEVPPDRPRHLRLLYSTDGGATFQGDAAIEAGAKGSFATASFSAGVVLEDGTFLAPFRTANRPAGARSASEMTHSIETVSSGDGGVTLSEPRLVSTLVADADGCPIELPVMAVDRSHGPFRGRIYMAWGDSVHRVDPRLHDHRCSILLSHSVDKGNTWSKPSVVDDSPDGLAPGGVSLPAISVNRDGVIGLVWYDRRRDPVNRGFHLRFSASLDGGDTFIPSIAPSRYDYSYASPEHYPIGASSSSLDGLKRTLVSTARSYYGAGDTNGVAADANGDFHVFWIDNHTGVARLYTASIKVVAKPILNGSPALSELQDVTDRVELMYSRTAYDAKTHAISIDLKLRNASKTTLTAPLKLRVITLSSAIGQPQATQTENGVTGPGAIWDLTGFVRDGQLRADERSSARRLTFKIVGFRPLQGNRDRGGALLQFDTKVYAETNDQNLKNKPAETTP